MSRPWIWNLGLLAVLAVVIARFPASLSERQVTIPPVAPPPARERLALPPAPSLPAAEALQEIVNRNLFSPLRGKVELSTATKPPAPPPVAAPLKVTLFGVVIEGEDEKYAFLQDASQRGGSRPKKYREGDSFAGAKVKSIRPDRVVLETGSREQTVNLRAPKEGIPAFKPTSLPVNPAGPDISTMPGSAGRAPGTPAGRSVRRPRRPDTAPTRQQVRPSVLDGNAERSFGRRQPGRTDRRRDYSRERYPEPDGDPAYYYDDQGYGGEGNGAPW